MKRIFFVYCVLLSLVQNVQGQSGLYHEPYRPQFHFSPKEKWMNDPNGMLFENGTYHLFFQYYPEKLVWGPMHWGHATSTDMIHWKQQPIALYPDSMGYIFSGSAVVDKNNSSGFGKNGQSPLVAIFTYHDPIGEKGGRTDFQTQAIAYSLDHGQTWTKYDKNPVLQNPGIRDFRDPKLSWYEPGKKWIMTLATLDRISFFSSTDLKHWKKESEFGKTYGGHGGVWECPDLFPMSVGGKNMWVLLVSINPGGPNKGSATQYFIGQFDGKSFTSTQKDTRWIDYGPDDYAGVTWSNTGNRRIFLGWMGNWIYAMEVPTQPWRSAMTLPRELSLSKLGNDYFLVSRLAAETGKLKGLPVKMADLDGSNLDISGNTGVSANAGWVKLSADAIKSYAVVLSNDQGEEVEIGYDAAQNNYYIDRSKSGIVNFKEGFSGRFTAPRISKNLHMDIELVMDKASVEVFADGGVSVMTGIYFPHQEFTHIRLKSTGKLKVALLQAAKMHSAW